MVAPRARPPGGSWFFASAVPSNGFHATVTDDNPSFLSPLRHRVLQAEGRRYSIKLEQAYWDILEGLARARNIRLARLIDEIARASKGKSSLSAALRLCCLEAVAEAQGDTGGAGSKSAGSGGGYGASLENLINANPSPCLLLAQDGRILLANEAFQRWSGVNAESVTGRPYDWYFQLRLPDTLNRTVARMAREGGHQATRVSYVAPGRVVVANGRVCLGHYASSQDYTWVVMVETLPTER